MSNALPWWMRERDTRTDWMEHGICRQVDPDLFFPEYGANITHKARKVCAGCPVQDECLTYALEHPGILGVWGGTTETERHRLNKVRRENVA